MRIALLTYDLPEANIVTHRLLRDFGDEIVGIVQSKAVVPGRSDINAMRHVGRKMGLQYSANWLLHLALARLGSIYLRARRQPAGFGSLAAIAAEQGIAVYPARNVHGREAINMLASWTPDLLVSNYFNQILRKPVLDVAPIGTINMHPAMLPRNRGLMPCFWALAKGDAQTGATVHWVDEGVDTGRIIVQESVEIREPDSVVSLSARCSESGAGLLRDTIERLENGPVAGDVQDEANRSYQSWPSVGGVRRLHRHGHRYGSMREMWAQVGRPAS